MALTNDAILANRMTLLRSHGITRDPLDMTHAPDGDWYYQQIDLGFNYRMTELQAALGVSQMSRLDQYVARRHELAQCYDQLLADLPIQLPYRAEYGYSAFHLYIVQLMRDGTSLRSKVFDNMRSKGIGVNVHYIPVHTQPYYAMLGQKVGYDGSSFPQANLFYAQALSLPLYPALTEAQQDTVVGALRSALA